MVAKELKNTTEFESIKQFKKEHQFTEYHIPPDYEILGKVADTPRYIREYFEWKGNNNTKKFMNIILRDVIQLIKDDLNDKIQYESIDGNEKILISLYKDDFSAIFDKLQHKCVICEHKICEKCRQSKCICVAKPRK